jgi:hypothetical protein
MPRITRVVCVLLLSAFCLSQSASAEWPFSPAPPSGPEMPGGSLNPHPPKHVEIGNKFRYGADDNQYFLIVDYFRIAEHPHVLVWNALDKKFYLIPFGGSVGIQINDSKDDPMGFFLEWDGKTNLIVIGQLPRFGLGNLETHFGPIPIDEIP